MDLLLDGGDGCLKDLALRLATLDGLVHEPAYGLVRVGHWVRQVLLVDGMRHGPDVDLWLLVDTLLGVAQAGDAGLVAVLRHPVVDLPLVAGAVVVDQALVVPGPVLLRRQLVPIPLPHSQQGMAVRVAWFVVDRHVTRHADVDVRLQVPTAPGGPPALGDFQWDCKLHLAGKLRVLALLRTLHGVPEKLAVGGPGRSTDRKQDLLMEDLWLPVAPDALMALVGQGLA